MTARRWRPGTAWPSPPWPTPRRALSAVDPDAASAYSGAASRAATTIVDGLLGPDGALGRSWKDGRAVGSGVLEDYADLADGLLALYEATFDERWFETARALMDRVLARFADPAGGFFDTADDHERLVTRPKDVQDNAVPSGNAMAARVLLRLAAWTGDGAVPARRGAGDAHGRPVRRPVPDRVRPVARRDGPGTGARPRDRDRGRARQPRRSRRSSPRCVPDTGRTRSWRWRRMVRRARCRCSTTDPRSMAGRAPMSAEASRAACR